MQTTAGIKPFEMIGQRLYTGRVAVAQAALTYCRTLYDNTRAYTDAKQITSSAFQGVFDRCDLRRYSREASFFLRGESLRYLQD